MNHSRSIAVFGDVMLDLYWKGNTNRLSPESPVPIVNIKKISEKLGGAANVALNIRALGESVSLVGRIGDDLNGEKVQSLCNEHQIETHLLRTLNYPTITKLRIISRQQHIVRCDFEEEIEFNEASQSESFPLYQKIIDNAELIILSDYHKGFLENPQKIIQYARSLDKKVIVDPKGHDFTKYRNSTLLTPNLSEFEAIVGTCHSEEILLQKAEQLRHELNLEALLITRSEKGMTLIEKNKRPITFSAKAKDVFDVTGAGDTVIALISTYLARKYTFADACHIANIGASIVVGKMGAAQVTSEELDYVLKQSTRAHHRILNQKELLIEVNNARQKNETIVMTNGCFDIIHRGHVLYLEEARKLGHRLIVALNSDQSIKRIKGDERPIMDEESRAAVLAALASVDWVILFDEDSPEILINEILPDILVKGSDYQNQEIKGANAVINNGGRVELIDFIEGYSTTKAINKIKKMNPY